MRLNYKYTQSALINPMISYNKEKRKTKAGAFFIIAALIW